MGALNKLTAVQIRAAKPGMKLEDGGGLRFVAKAGGGNWVFRFSLNGRRREMGLGNLRLAEARKERMRWAAEVAAGRDPIIERQRLADIQRDDGEMTFEQALARFFAGYCDRLKSEQAAKNWGSCLRVHVLPKIGRVRIVDLHQRHIHDAIEPIWRTKHVTAGKALQRTRMVIEWARLAGYPVDPFICDAAQHMLGHVHYVKTPIVATSWRDVPAVYRKLDHLIPTHLALRLIMLTAVRGGSARGARFDEIEGDVWTVPAERMKGQRGKTSDFRVPLSLPALELVEICRGQANGSPYLFPSPVTGKPITDVSIEKALNKINEHGRPHGFRSSLRSWVQDTNAASYEVTETALAHVIGNKVERSYARSDLLDQRRILMQNWADHVTSGKEDE